MMSKSSEKVMNESILTNLICDLNVRQYDTVDSQIKINTGFDYEK